MLGKLTLITWKHDSKIHMIQHCLGSTLYVLCVSFFCRGMVSPSLLGVCTAAAFEKQQGLTSKQARSQEHSFFACDRPSIVVHYHVISCHTINVISSHKYHIICHWHARLTLATDPRAAGLATRGGRGALPLEPWLTQKPAWKSGHRLRAWDVGCLG